MGDNRYPRPLAERFWEKVNKTSTCWLWTGYTMKHRPVGYYRVSATKCDYCPRIAWQLTRGEIPEGIYVLHTCDNATCVNPDHLFLGTQFDNMRDMEQKKRGRKSLGSAHYNSKLQEYEIKAIRQLAPLASQQALGNLYGVSQAHISHILLNKSWKHVNL